MFMRDTTLRSPLVDVIWPARSLTRDSLLVIATSLLLALSAQVGFPLPFSPVPVTFQTFVVLAAGAVLGSRLGALSVLVYLTEGMIGLPFFAKGAAGIAYLRGATGGYLLGFVAAAFVVGLLVERGWGRKVSTAMMAMGIGNVVLYVFGIAWLQTILNISTTKALFLGLYPFIAGDLYKIGIGALLLPVLGNFLGNPKD
ncbi:BioY protein [Candidatus Vecturithrix granuli]|uniref:Biotin transporter n=1 Tax=Vecturithrix granuli TaxID=1499967 RepID=A0A081BU25_VECG1|nr:BioY protein [Candidatus Vecturithrix granuli]